MERDVSLAVCGSCVPCPYNQPLHSLSLVHGVMNPQVPALHQGLLCPDSLPVSALPAPPAQPSLWVPGWAQARGHCWGQGDAVFRGVSKSQDPPAVLHRPDHLPLRGGCPATDSPEHALPATCSCTSPAPGCQGELGQALTLFTDACEMKVGEKGDGLG